MVLVGDSGHVRVALRSHPSAEALRMLFRDNRGDVE